MNQQLNMVQHEEFGKLEILTIDGKPYFPAKECASILGYSNARDAIARHCQKDGVVKHDVIDRLGREQKKQYINEGNLYRLIVRSKLPAAVRFESWVFDEVLPAIREHGVYATDDVIQNVINDPDLAYKLFCQLQTEQGKTTALEAHVEKLAPKARYCDIILQCRNAVPVSLIAADYGMSAISFNRLLHDLGVQHKVGGAWILYQCYKNKGYTVSRTYYTPGGTAVLNTCWTQKGRRFLYDLLCCYGIFPDVEIMAGIH